MNSVFVKVLREEARDLLPKYATPGSAAFDIHSLDTVIIPPFSTEMVGTGLAVYIQDPKLAGLLLPRSSMGKRGLMLANSVGLIDSDYQGELKVMLWNRTDDRITINPLERIAQLMIIPVVQVQLNVVMEFESTERGTGGFGSTGV